MKDVLEFVKENDVKFIRLNFCDIFGLQKNISIMADELESAIKNGVSFDAHVIRGFRDITQSDLFLFPDTSTLAVLPWRPGPGRVIRFFCDIKKSYRALAKNGLCVQNWRGMRILSFQNRGKRGAVKHHS